MINPNDRLEAIWCWDSETGKKVLINVCTNKIIMTEDDLKKEKEDDDENRVSEETFPNC
jgi:hypothetical protein